MGLAPKTRLGPYEIDDLIGAGGMGEVYRATDTRLNRVVAIKTLPQHWARDAESEQRFEREAQTIAALNHPNICTLHDVGRHEETSFLVLEYLEGETLAKRLERRPLQMDEALKAAVQIADALDKAHGLGVVHRDLKPSNVMLTKSGAKLLDFGLAKFKASPERSAVSSMAPTRAEVTTPGMIVGTVQSMRVVCRRSLPPRGSSYFAGPRTMPVRKTVGSKYCRITAFNRSTVTVEIAAL